MGAPTFDFSGQVVLVAGGSSGAVTGIVTAFLDAGARVVTCGPDEAEGAVEGATFITADLRRAEQCRLAVATAAEQFGRLDVLINMASALASTSAEAASPASPEAAESVVAAILLAPFYCAQAAQPIMAAQPEGGAIVNVVSVSGRRPSPGSAAHGAANAGLISLTSTLAQEWAPEIRVGCVSVRGLEADPAARTAGLGGSVPGAGDVASTCLFLASPAATLVTGATVVVPGEGWWPRYLTAQG